MKISGLKWFAMAFVCFIIDSLTFFVIQRNIFRGTKGQKRSGQGEYADIEQSSYLVIPNMASAFRLLLMPPFITNSRLIAYAS
jgi:hypothetical protein